VEEFPRLSGQRRALLAQAANRYQEAFPSSPAEQYLAGRGISADVARKFQLGYVEDPMEGHERFAGRLAIPYRTPSGVSCIRYRSLESKPEKRKYDQESGARTPLYNVQDLHRSDPWIAVCEGELDALVMSGIVGVPAVGIPGVDHWNRNGSVWSRLLQDYETVFIVMDPDKSGQDLVPEVAKRVENPVVIDLPADVNDTVNEHGPEWVLDKLGIE
jgi:DNA primase